MIECPGCGSNLIYDIARRNMYCKAIFMTSDTVGFPTAQYAEQKYDEIYGDASGVMFLIDMTHRPSYDFLRKEKVRVTSSTGGGHSF